MIAFTPGPPRKLMSEPSIPLGSTSAAGTWPSLTSVSASSRVSGCPAAGPVVRVRGVSVSTRSPESASSAFTSARDVSLPDSSTTATGTGLAPSMRLPPPPKMTAKIEKNMMGTTNASTCAARSRRSWRHELPIRSPIIRAAPFP